MLPVRGFGSPSKSEEVFDQKPGKDAGQLIALKRVGNTRPKTYKNWKPVTEGKFILQMLRT